MAGVIYFSAFIVVQLLLHVSVASNEQTGLLGYLLKNPSNSGDNFFLRARREIVSADPSSHLTDSPSDTTPHQDSGFSGNHEGGHGQDLGGSQSDVKQDSHGNNGNQQRQYQNQDMVANHRNDQPMHHGRAAEYHHGMQAYDSGSDLHRSSELGPPTDSSHDGAVTPSHDHTDLGYHDTGSTEQPQHEANQLRDHHTDRGRNPLYMTRQGELPPMALPLSQDAMDSPQALPLVSRHSVYPREQAAPTDPQSDTPSEVVTEQPPLEETTHHQDTTVKEHGSTDNHARELGTGHTDGHRDQPRFAYLSGGPETRGQDPYSHLQHSMQPEQVTGFKPHTLPMTGNRDIGFQRRARPEAREGAPVALPQRQDATPTPSDSRRPPPNWGASQSAGGGVPLTRGRPSWEAPGAQTGGMGGGIDPVHMIQQIHAADRIGDHVDSAMETAKDIIQDVHKASPGLTGHAIDPRFDPRFDIRGGSSDPRRRFPADQRFDTQSRNQQSYYNRNQYPGYPPGYPPYPPYGYPGYGDRPDRPEYNVYGDYGGYQGYGGYGGYPGYNVEVSNVYPPCTNMSDPMCRQMLQQRAMYGGDGGYGQEIQVEGPHGEMDIEPGEMDIEGPIAHHLLRNIGLGTPNMNPLHQEITLNTHVLEALKTRFGVNTTTGVQRMSSNPEFQAFMYRVLTHSAPVAPGEYNANLTKVEVDNLLQGLGQSNYFQRLSPGNLNHAQINSSRRDPSQQVLTIDGGPQPNPFMTPNMMGPDHAWTPMQNIPPLSEILPGLALPQTQGQASAGQGQVKGQSQGEGQVAQAGRTEALVQTLGEEGAPTRAGGEGSAGGERAEGGAGGEAGEGALAGGEAGEMAETQEAGNKTSAQGSEGHGNATAAATSEGEGHVGNAEQIQGGKVAAVGAHAVGATGSKKAASGVTKPAEQGAKHTGPTVVKTQLTIKDGKIVNEKMAASNTAQAPSGSGITGGEADILGKESKPGLSKDHKTAVDVAVGANNAGQGHGSGVNQGPPHNAGNGATNEAENPAGSPAGSGAASGNIALQEAGILTDPGYQNETNAVPMAPKTVSYKSSTIFAVVAIILIASAIILGPFICLMCKIKSRRDERLRKEKAMRNKDVSDNSIMEAMMMHEFGPDGPNSVANEEAAIGNIYKDTDHGRYVTIDTEMESMNRSRLP